ncbi:DNA-binding CsgD family transcriptional regulator [Sphingomonas vulcanisoli]|uniref:DNA-binding CsgD family transcriptional regulator n=1 Tax=Sphingomonas vulcanisoli TaxID=1658060 RepID=A0ABX0TN28_9SPHN|nr:LuxR C-terminal-related transcriptional regulator [Sphingomonas vulcanisoli]NIJ06513.1 DNA-binding CsgD family transcriptional regulator [Sphingomonas vulcanisoli]
MDWLNALVNAAYAAALDSDLWRPFADQLSLELASLGGIFAVINRQQLVPPVFETVRALEGVEYDYLAGGRWQHDPQVPMAGGLQSSAIYTDADVVRDETDEARAYRQWEQEWGSSHYLTTVGFLEPSGTGRGCFSFHYGPDGIAPDAVQKLQMLAPQLNRALALGFRHEEALSQEYWRGIAANDQSKALILLDERGRVIHLTNAAEAIIRQGDGLRIAAQSLWCTEPSQQEVLAALVGQAVGMDTISGAIRIARPSGRMPFLLTIFPLPRVRRILAPFEAAAIVQLVDPTARPLDARHLYRHAFKLSGRETDLAAALVKGHSPETAAAALNITVATARIHLRRLFQKTGTNRQSELIRLLIQIG